MDNFIVKGSDVGEVHRIVVWHDDTGLGSDWHLQQVGETMRNGLTVNSHSNATLSLLQAMVHNRTKLDQ